MTSCYIKHPLLSKQQFAKLAIDYLWFGNCYLERVRSRTGKLLALKHSPAKYMRRDKNDRYKFIAQADGWLADPNAWSWIEQMPVHTFPADSIFHLLQPDVNQELYGVPEWLPAVQSAQLNEAATKFRLRYYNNGSHAGYILYITDPAQDESDIEALETALRDSKGPGNFRNLLYYAPNGKTDGLKLMPISEVTAKDEFFNIKSISRDDQLAAARVPPNIMGIVPTNTSGFGSVTDAAQVFARNEVTTLQERFGEINDWLGQDVISFNPYQIAIEEGAKK
ncbi:phage portal protein [Rappaport israeli]|uniref:phage portal protein n=1 Tax=Rappaport israeli TaxID=1839807 RepID=UPI000AFA9C18|nr:phage portal protein [Rappaport israeli]